MIIVLLMMMQSVNDAPESTPQEIAFCSGDESGQPFRFCLADRMHDRAAQALATALAAARRSALVQKNEIERFSRRNGGVTFTGDPVSALTKSQRAWEQSYRADCAALGLSVATGSGGTEGVTTNWECEASRIFDRIQFLNKTYAKGS